jgi:hypothetical protein
MASDRTKAAILTAMDAAQQEGRGHAWDVLDRLFAAMTTGEAGRLAQRLYDPEVGAESAYERSPMNVAHDTDMVYASGEPLPACATPHSGRPS